METKDCILNRRSVRKFTKEPVPRELLQQVVQLASYAPSWKNTQISRYIAIEDPAILSKICADYVPEHNANIIGGCGTLIAQSFIKSRSGFNRDGSCTTDRKDGWQYYDCGIACQTLCLAAHDLGLGTVVMGVFDREGLTQYLQIPEDQELMALIAIGYPNEAPTAPKRKDVETLLSFR